MSSVNSSGIAGESEEDDLEDLDEGGHEEEPSQSRDDDGTHPFFPDRLAPSDPARNQTSAPGRYSLRRGTGS